MTKRALLLNIDYSPLAVMTARRAVEKYLAGKLEVVEYSEHVFRSTSATVMVPAIMRTLRYIDLPAKQRSVLITRDSVLQRDEFICAYCGLTGLTKANGTMDHVIPRSRGGRHTWGNVTAACDNCNQRKRDHTLEEMRMMTPPKSIDLQDWVKRWTLDRECPSPSRLFTEDPDPSWMPYLQV